MRCLLPAFLLALSGKSPIPYPANQGPAVQVHPPAGEGRGICGDSLEQHLETEHFTLQVVNGPVDEARMAEIAAVLEEGWQNLVEKDGWTAPAYSQNCLLWMFLDVKLDGSGITYVEDSEAGKYPVSYLNPTLYLEDDPAFMLSVAVHEFAHVLQFEVEDGDNAARSWYWEASAEWMAELGAPEIDTYAESTWAYANRPELSYNSTKNLHPYGMFLLNAWIDEGVGHDAVRDAWLTARQHPDEDWDLRLARVSNEDFGTLIQDFSGHYLAGALRESALYEGPVREATFTTVPTREAFTLPGIYGTYYMDFGDGGAGLKVEGPVAATYVADGEILEAPPVSGPFTAAFTAIGTEGMLVLGDDLDADSADTGQTKEPKTCGCESGSGALWLGLLAIAIVMRPRWRADGLRLSEAFDLDLTHKIRRTSDRQ